MNIAHCSKREQDIENHAYPICRICCRKQEVLFLPQYSRRVTHRGKNRATMAVVHSMAIAIFFVLTGADFYALGVDYYTQFNREKKVNPHLK